MAASRTLSLAFSRHDATKAITACQSRRPHERAPRPSPPRANAHVASQRRRERGEGERDERYKPLAWLDSMRADGFITKSPFGRPLPSRGEGGRGSNVAWGGADVSRWGARGIERSQGKEVAKELEARLLWTPLHGLRAPMRWRNQRRCNGRHADVLGEGDVKQEIGVPM